MADGRFGGGNGTESKPYLVEDANDLNAVRNNLTAYFKQTKNIDLSTYSNWIPIGTSDNPFSGYFDGSDLEIANLSINLPKRDECGLFGRVDGDTYRPLTITNTRLKNCNVIGQFYVGGLVGKCWGYRIENCSAEGRVSGFNDVGGLIGMIQSTEVKNCNSKSIVSGDSGIGGLIGWLTGTDVKRCFSEGKVSGVVDVGGLIGQWSGFHTLEESYAICDVGGIEGSSAYNVGGLVGGFSSKYQITRGVMINCYALGSVRAGDKITYEKIIGGLIGILEIYDTEISKPSNVVLNSYSASKVTGDKKFVVTGGLIGKVDFRSTPTPIPVTNSHYDSQISGQYDTGKGFPRTTEQMKRKSTYSGWNFDTVWKIDDGKTYPTFIFLKSEEITQCTAFRIFLRMFNNKN